LSTPAIEIEDLTVAYGERPALWDIDLKVPTGVMMGLIGPNGAGKSTLIKTVMGLIKPAAGTVRIFGKPLSETGSRVAYVPQRSSVDWDFPATVMDVALMGCFGRLGWLGRPKSIDRQTAREALARVGISNLATRPVHQLSGGQQQRVFLARALVQKAELYLLDEPFQGVDAATESLILDLLRTIRSEGGTVVVVHHDLQTVADRFDQAALLKVKLLASGPVDEVMTPELLQKAYGSSGAGLVTSRDGHP
jgi:manganese/zinc/iron transport system ATP- binding protein